jgi:hypothetical protein
MYAHPWAFEVEKGDMMITWSKEGETGNVVAAKVRLKTIKDGEEEQTDGGEVDSEVEQTSKTMTRPRKRNYTRKPQRMPRGPLKEVSREVVTIT